MIETLDSLRDTEAETRVTVIAWFGPGWTKGDAGLKVLDAYRTAVERRAWAELIASRQEPSAAISHEAAELARDYGWFPVSSTDASEHSPQPPSGTPS